MLDALQDRGGGFLGSERLQGHTCGKDQQLDTVDGYQRILRYGTEPPGIVKHRGEEEGLAVHLDRAFCRQFGSMGNANWSSRTDECALVCDSKQPSISLDSSRASETLG